MVKRSKVQSLGYSPAFLTRRPTPKRNPWCRQYPPDYDPLCDPENPKTITYKQVIKAAEAIKDYFPKTPLRESSDNKRFALNLHYKMEMYHKTGSYKDRVAVYCLRKLKPLDMVRGVVTAGLKNWVLAMSYHGYKLKVPLTIVVPEGTDVLLLKRCQEYGAKVVTHGNDVNEAAVHALLISKKLGQMYINGQDHPDVIAACGTIGLEILEDLPEVEAILVPVGGGALVAGIIAVVKLLKPSVLVYGVETTKNCSFFKALKYGRPIKTHVDQNLANSLDVPRVGWNSYETAHNLIDKMAIVDDDSITSSMLYLVEQEGIVAEGAAAATVSALMTLPKIAPELCYKTVVCVLTGGNVDVLLMPIIMERAKAIDGRIVQMRLRLPTDVPTQQKKVLGVVRNVGANITDCRVDYGCWEEPDLDCIYMTVNCELRDIEHACRLRRVMERLFPGTCRFVEQPYLPKPICPCYPKRFP